MRTFQTKLDEALRGPRLQLLAKLERLRPALVAAAQAVLDRWTPDDDGLDEEFGGGGACDAVAAALGDVIASNVAGVEFADYGHEGDDHAATIVFNRREAYLVDVPHHLYETGGGYRWTKHQGVVLEPKDVEIIPLDPRDFQDEP